MSFYPDIRAGDDVVFTNDPNSRAAQWRLGKVTTAKNESADVMVFGPNGMEHRHDCLYATDPRIQATKLWAEPGRGVFQLAAHEIERRQDRERLPDLEKKLIRLEANLEALVLQSAAKRSK